MFFDMNHLSRGSVAPHTSDWFWPRSAARKTRTNVSAQGHSAMAPTRVLSRSCEGELKADVLRQADEGVASSFILFLGPGHAPGPRRYYSTASAVDSLIPGGVSPYRGSTTPTKAAASRRRLVLC